MLELGKILSRFKTAKIRLPVAWAIVFVLLIIGCAHRARQVFNFREEFYSGNLVAADARLATLVQEKRKDSDAFKLDQAMVKLTSGDPQQSERMLREVRDRLDFLEQRDAREIVRSMMQDDQQLAWSGSDYEKVLVRVMLTITNLMNGGEDAIAYALQINEKQNEIIARIENSRRLDDQNTAEELQFRRVALGPYLHAALLEERHLDYDDLERSRLKVASWETTFRDAQIDLARAREGTHSEPGNGVVYVICLVGRGPQKVEAIEAPTTVAMLIADRILNAFTEQEITPTIAPVKVPVVVPGRSMIRDVQVSIGGQVLGTTATITNVSDFAVEQSQAEFPDVLARAVVRRALKKAAIYAAKDQLGAQRSGVTDLALTAAGVAWEATEHADTRCWNLLPDQIQVLRAEIPAGTREITLAPRIPAGHPGPGTNTVSTIVRVQDGRNTYLLATIPDTRILGEVLSSSSDELLTSESVSPLSSPLLNR